MKEMTRKEFLKLTGGKYRIVGNVPYYPHFGICRHVEDRCSIGRNVYK